MKRLFDVIVSLLLLAIFLLPMAIIAILIIINMGSPVIFKQKRPGLYGEIFIIYKFRTMKNSTDEKGVLLPNSERLTGLGNVLRKLSLDELPQLFNVLKGDISLVGPRPLLVKYLNLYTEEQARRHDVRPGITGWAQVNGRNTISWEERFVLDIWYVDNQTFLLDIKILLMTVLKVFKREGVNKSGGTTMERFKGNKILVYGAGGLGRGIVELLESINKSNFKIWEIEGFVDDQAVGIINGYEVWGTTEDLMKIKEPISVILALGSPQIKKSVYDKLKYNSKIKYPNIIHPSVEVSKFNVIGYGNVISKGVSMSTNIQMKNFNLIHYNSSIGHDVSIGNYNSMFPITSLSGYVTLEDEVELGANSTVLPSIKVNNKVRIGAGSVVTKDITENSTVVGVPAKLLE